MAPLRLGLLGTLHITRAGTPARLESDGARALLAYLAVEANHPHRRDALLGLLWPDSAEPAARHKLRQAIGDPAAQPPYLLISRDDLQFSPASDFELDVAAFSAHLAASANWPTCAGCWPIPPAAA